MDVREFSAALVRANDIISPYVEGDFRREQRISGIIRQILDAHLFFGDVSRISVPPREAVANLLQCVLSWGPAEKIAAELDEAGLLAEPKEK